MAAGISWVAGTTSAYVNATSISASTPAGIQDNDGLFAFVYGRSTLTAPSGWTLVGSAVCIGSSTTQTLYCYRKDTVVAANSSTAYTWSQVSSNRMGVTYAVVRAGEGSVRVLSIGGNNTNNATTTTVLAPSIVATRASSMGLLAATTVLAAATSFTPTPPTGGTLWSGGVADNRLAGAYDAVDEGDSTGGTNWTIASGTVTSNGVAAVTLIVYDSAVELTLTDTSSFQAINASGAQHTDTLTDTTGVDPVSNMGVPLAAADTVGVDPAVGTAFGATASATFRTTDFLAQPNHRYALSLLDTVGTAEVMKLNFGALVAEMLRLLDPTVSIAKYGLALSDQTRLAEQLISARPELLSDTVGLARIVKAFSSVYAVEVLRLADVINPKLFYKLAVVDQIRLSDVLRRFFAGDVVEGLGVADVLAVRPLFGRVLAETVGVAETLTPRMVFRLVEDDTLGLSDTQALKMIFRGVLTDGVELSALYVSPDGNITTWAINTKTGAVTEYSNYEFNSFARSGFKYLGASSSGLYELDGDDDAGTDIVSVIKSGLAQFGGSRFTAFKAAYLGIRGEGDFYLRLETGRGEFYNYKFVSQDMNTTKVQMGKGLRARYFSFQLTSTGQDFDLESIEFVPLVAQRRV